MNTTDLQKMGILTSKDTIPLHQLSKQYWWLFEVERIFLINILLSEEGLTKSQIKVFEKQHNFKIARVLGSSLTQWEYNNRGIPTYLKLTWQGTELAEYYLRIAKQENANKNYNARKNKED